MTNIQAQIEGSAPSIKFLVSTAGNGLLLYKDGKLSRIINGDIIYGLTKEQNNWWVFQQNGDKGSVISFNINDHMGYNIRVRIPNLNQAIHQIDFIRDDLLVVDTFRNRVQVFKNAVSKIDDTLLLLPRGPVANRKDRNYCHLNSVYSDGERIYILAHNNINKTGSKSEVFVYDMNYTRVGVLPMTCSGAHNYVRFKDAEWICDSESGTLLRNNKPVFSAGEKAFTRGLSISDEYILLGSSGISPIRVERKHRDGHVYIFDKKFQQIAKITIPKTQIMEIRQVDRDDYTLSNTERV